MKTIVATAYAVNPYKGSEDGMGWNFVLQIAKYNKVIAITRKNNQSHIEKYMNENPSILYENLEFMYYDTSYWLRFWKKGSRGAMLYYLLWQRGVVAFIKSRKLIFDIVHNLNFHNDWSPSYLWKLNKPFVWGPIGHHPFIPNQYLQKYHFKYKITNVLTWLVKKCFWNFSLDVKQTKNKASHILCMNSSVSSVLNLKTHFSIMPSVATQDFDWNRSILTSGKFTLISAGRFVPLKGFDLALHAFASFLEKLENDAKIQCELLLIGNGPEEDVLKNMARKLGIYNNVKFIAWIQRDELLEKFKSATAFLFPSHEGAGMVVAEALSFGLPVICLDNCGPGEFVNNECAFIIKHNNYTHTVNDMSNSIYTLFSNPDIRSTMSFAARSKFSDDFNWDNRGDELNLVYQDL